MIFELLQLILLFAVIYDPMASYAVFSIATKEKKSNEIRKTAILSVFVAGAISFVVLILGDIVLSLLNTEINDFRVAGGVILAILGVNMALGRSISEDLEENSEENSPNAIAAIIGTPILAGPAAITTIIITVQDYGQILTGIAVLIVLLITGLLFIGSKQFNKYLGETTLQVFSAILGLVTLAWGIKFIREGLIIYLASAGML